MSTDKAKESNNQPSAPSYPVENEFPVQSEDITSQASPPPYYQPLPQYNPQQATTAPTPGVYVTPISMPTQVGSSPTRLRCPNCHADIVTQIRHKSGCMTWAICGSICAIGLFAPCAWLGCQFLPFCIDSCKDVQHNCPNCRAYIGTFDRMN